MIREPGRWRLFLYHHQIYSMSGTHQRAPGVWEKTIVFLNTAQNPMSLGVFTYFISYPGCVVPDFEELSW